MTPAIALKSYSFVLVLSATWLCALRIPAPPPLAPLSPWRMVAVTSEPVQPLATPALFSQGILWQPLSRNELVFSGKQELRHNWLRGNLLTWEAKEADGQIFVVWQTLEGQLFSAVLGENGEQQSAPERLDVGGNIRSFAAVAPSDLIVVGVTADRQMFLRRVDGLGRPYFSHNLDIAAEQVAIAAHSDSELLLAWQSGRALYVGTWDLKQNQLIRTARLTAFELPAQSWLGDLHLILTDTQQIILWGITSASAPDRQRYGGAILPRAGLADPQVLVLNLPVLRWAQVNGSEGSFAAFLEGQWRPIKVNFGDSGALGYQVIDGPSVTASAVGFNADILAWVTLDEALQPRLYATSLGQGEFRYPELDFTWREALWRGLARLPLVLLWFQFPILVGFYWGKFDFHTTLALYWIGKCVIPLGFWTHFPQTLLAIGIEQPFLGGGGALLGISLVAGMMGRVGWGDTPSNIRHAAYFLTDAVLTCAILGAGLE